MKKILRPCLPWLGVLCLLGTPGTILGQQDESTLTKENVMADYKLAAEILKKQHPNPYKFVDSLTIEQQLDSLWQRMEEAPDVYASVSSSPVQLFKDVHTKLQLSPAQSMEGIKAINFFPFPVLIKDKRIFVNVRGEAIPYLAEIKAINGQSAADIIRDLENTSYSDGYIETGTDRVFRNFQIFYSWNHSTVRTYRIDYIESGKEKIKTKDLSALPPSQALHRNELAVYPFNRMQMRQQIFTEFDAQNQIGILTVNTFNMQESPAYRQFSNFFKEVKKRGYERVIIDIRNNGGGNPAISALLYSFLAPAAFDNIYNQRTRTNDFAFTQYLISNGQIMTADQVTILRNFMHQRFDWDPTSGFFVGNTRLRENQIENYPPDKETFSGEVYVLTSGGTISAATYFASLVQKNKRGLIIGSETGSGEASTTAAWFLNYELPHTKAILTIPMSEIYFSGATEDSGRGVIPDIEIPIDRFLEYAKDYCDPEVCLVKEIQ